jgi:hypothetical protein
MNGYKFTTEQEAIDARQLCNDLKGFPIEDMLNYVTYFYSEIDDFYYITHYYDIEQVLGEPIEFTVTQPELSL